MHGSRNEQSVVTALGKQRMEKYLSQMGNHAGRALQLYKWDAELSGAMWNLLSIFEVVLRNKICEAVDEWSEEQRPQSNKQWIRHPRVNVREPLSKVAASVAKDALRKALEAKKLRDEGDGLFIGNHPRKGQSITRDDVVAQVTLTQWKNNFFYRDPEELPMARTSSTPMRLITTTANAFMKRLQFVHFPQAQSLFPLIEPVSS